MSAAPRSPKEDRSFADRGAADVEDGAMTDRETGVRAGQPGDAEVDPGQQGGFGKLGQTLTTRWQVRDR